MNGPPREQHPDPSTLKRFMRGELPREEARAVVRHMLTECRRCSAITRSYLERGERLRGLERLVRETLAEGGTPAHDEPGLI